MKKILRIAGVTLVVLLAWAAFVAVASLEGWWHETLARPADTRAFMQAAVRNLEAAKVGNAVLAVMENGSVFEENISIGKPVTPNTLFQVASMSKWVSAWGVMALVENGKIDLDEPVSAYLTRWQIPPSEFDTDGITVRRLLSHTAGFSDGLGYGGFAPGEQLQTLEESLTRAADAVPIRSMTVGHEPGEKYAYSGGGYTLLQLLIEEVTGLGFETYMRQTIFEPLGMTQSTFDWQKANAGDLADFYDTDGSITTHYRYTALAAASLYTTVRDMTRFLQAHCSNERGEAPGRGVLAPETLLLMRQPHASPGLMQLWVDFSAYPVGTELTMQSLPFSAGRVGEWPWGVPHSRLERMSLEQFGAIRSGEEQPEIDPEGYTVFKVRVDREDDTAPLAIPQELSRIETLDPAAAANRDNPRSFNFSERASQMFINGPQFKMESVAEDEIVQLNTTEMWEFINVSGSSGGIHPVHVHGLQFQIIERSVDDVEESGWETVKEGFVDEGWQDTVLLTPAMRAKVLLRFADYVGLFVYHCHNLPHGDAGMMRNYRVESTETAVLERYFDRRPETFILEQNYPNPFNSSTTISFTLPARGETELVVYNLLKQKVATIVQGVRPAGAYAVHWDGRDDQGRPLASGTYFYSLQMADQLRTRKLSLLR